MIKPGGKNHYCGPFVIGYLAGIDSDEAAKEIRKVSGQRAVKWTWTRHLNRVLTNLGICKKGDDAMVSPGGIKGCTWKAWSHNHMKPKSLYLVLITGHFIIVDAGVVKDNYLFNGTLAKDMPARKRVKHYWEIER